MNTGSVHVEELARTFEVSLMTVYRDVESLEAVGVLYRTRGQVAAAATSLNETTAQFRHTQNVEAKRAIAAVARKFLRPGHSVLVDDSSTAYRVLETTGALAPLTIVTNSQAVATAVAGRVGVELFLAGGQYRPVTDSYVGPTTTGVLGEVRADVCIMSATAVGDGVFYHPYEENVQVKRAMLAAARQRILVVDHTKFARHSLHTVAGVGEIDVLIVDAVTPEQDLAPFRDAGVQVEVAAG